MDTIVIPTLAEAIALINRHDPCGDKSGCSVTQSLATNSSELNDIVGECARYRKMRPLRDALTLVIERVAAIQLETNVRRGGDPMLNLETIYTMCAAILDPATLPKGEAERGNVLRERSYADLNRYRSDRDDNEA